MRINVVIVDEDVDRAARVGRHMADNLRRDFRDWKMTVHIRTPLNLIGRDDGYAEYSG